MLLFVVLLDPCFGFTADFGPFLEKVAVRYFVAKVLLNRSTKSPWLGFPVLMRSSQQWYSFEVGYRYKQVCIEVM
jgi:hypothetical protein